MSAAMKITQSTGTYCADRTASTANNNMDSGMKCPVCSEKFQEPFDLQIHLNNHSKRELIEEIMTVNNLYTNTTESKKVYSLPAALPNKRPRKLTGAKPDHLHVCSVCSLLCSSAADLAAHMDKHKPSSVRSVTESGVHHADEKNYMDATRTGSAATGSRKHLNGNTSKITDVHVAEGNGEVVIKTELPDPYFDGMAKSIEERGKSAQTLNKNSLDTFEIQPFSALNAETDSEALIECEVCEMKFMNHGDQKNHYADCHPERLVDEDDVRGRMNETDKSMMNVNRATSQKLRKKSKNSREGIQQSRENPKNNRRKRGKTVQLPPGVKPEVYVIQNNADASLHNVSKIGNSHFCHVCNEGFMSLSDVRLHMFTHPGAKPFKCNDCDEAFDSLLAVDGHRQSDHGHYVPQGSVNLPGVQCKIGKAARSSTYTMVSEENDTVDTDMDVNDQVEVGDYGRKHTKVLIKRKRGRPKSANPKKYQRRSSTILLPPGVKPEIYVLQKPNETPASNIYTPKEGHLYPCHVCNKGLASVADLRYHMYNHPGEKPFKCKQCSESFDWGLHLKEHVQEKHGEDQLMKCQFCDKEFKDVAQLRLHNYHHTGGQPYYCDVCGRGFMSSHKMKLHKETHEEGYDPLKCKVCEEKFKTRTEMVHHMADHTGKKKIQCDICKKVFLSSSSLRKHMTKHTGEKAYKCTLCAKRLVSAYLLKQHMKIHTGERDHFCEVCNKGFIKLPSLTHHMKKKHGIIRKSTRLKRGKFSEQDPAEVPDAVAVSAEVAEAPADATDGDVGTPMFSNFQEDDGSDGMKEVVVKIEPEFDD